MTGEGVCGIMTVEAVTVHSIWQETYVGTNLGLAGESREAPAALLFSEH